MSREDYNRWRNDPVTINLFIDLDLAVLDEVNQSIDPDDPIEAICMLNEGGRAVVRVVQEYEPTGIEDSSDED